MTKINMGKIKTLKDYIHILCKYKGITMKQMCEDLNISYDSFKVDITKSIDVKYLFIIINYLDGDFLFAFDLLLNIDNTNSDDNVPTNTSLSIENFKDMVFDSLEDYRQQFEKFVNYYVDQNDIKTCIKSSGKLGELLTASCNIVVEPLDIYGEISTHYRFYMRRWDKPVYELLTKDDIQNYLFLIIKFLGLDSEKFSRWPKPKFIIEDLECFAFSNELTIYNPAPAYYVLTLNGIFNRKTKEFYPENSDKYNKLTKKYHFIDNASFNYLTESTHPEIIDLYKDFINRISNRNDSLKNEIEQHLCSVLN